MRRRRVVQVIVLLALLKQLTSEWASRRARAEIGGASGEICSDPSASPGSELAANTRMPASRRTETVRPGKTSDVVGESIHSFTQPAKQLSSSMKEKDELARYAAP